MAQNTDQQVDALWKQLYNLLRGPGRLVRLPSVMNPTFQMATALPDNFDDELLNEVASLKQASEAEWSDRISQIRGKINICVTTGAIGHADDERLQLMLDALEK